MAKKADDEIPSGKEVAGEAPAEVAFPDPVEFTVSPPQNAPPTEAQMKWMADHPAYRRISHSVLGRSTARGTLTSDGSFIPDSQMPVHDGGGSFGVGIPQ